ncbi:Hypothetical predicted protein [Cloeon dipterum]|uniref:Angiotensin-converting enzyme n=1 Tax=Cloeon dipterum TaxID=197152 RepID=A0A8S1BUL3_9INSE|nr:Hypothetical predicted protein [Cloeon dipterum]
MQTDWKNGYSKAQKLWAEVEPLYKKFHDYVRRRLQKVYADVPEDIPIHLLGSPEGIDWSYISKEALLLEDLMKSVESSISQQDKKQLYIMAEKMSQDLGLPELSHSFLEESKFNGQCPADVIFACSDEGARVMTCNATSWIDYLEAHENVFRASYFTLAARTNSYIFRHGNRYSAIPEAMSGLGALLATANVVDAKLLSRDPSDPLGQAVNLRMLVALKTLPRLPYLLGVDLCRIRDASNPSHPLPPYCWQLRKKMQRVAPPDALKEEEIYDLFADRAVASNAPRLSEFAGTIIQFQLYEYLTKLAGSSRRDLFKLGIGNLQIDDPFRSMLRAGLTQPWPEVLGEINITEISTAPLLKFFKPLLPILEDMATLDSSDYEDETESPPKIETSSVSTPTTKSIRMPKPTDSSVQSVKSAASTAAPTASEDTPTESNLANDEENNMNTSQPTTIIAIGGILLGVVIVVAAIFIVNRRRKSQPELRKTSNGAQYEAVIRRSAGRPASFSPAAAKRLSENGNSTPKPAFSTFRSPASSPDVESPTETIVLEETEAKRTSQTSVISNIRE